MVDAVPNYGELLRVARERFAGLTDEVLNAGRANREMLETLIMGEVDRAASRLGFARAEEVDRLRVELAELRVDLRDLSGDVTRLRTEGTPPPVKKTAAKKTTAKKAAGAAGGPG